MTVNTEGDSAALLSIAAAEDYEGKIITDDDEIFDLDIGGVENGNSINRNARTVLDDLVVLTNQGTQDINTITFDVSGDGEDILEIQEDTEADMPLTTGQETMFGIEVDLLDDTSDAVTEDGDIDDANFDPTITITAEN